MDIYTIKNYRLGRSLSLSRSDQKKTEAQISSPSPNSKNKNGQAPSPKPKTSPKGVIVRARKATYELAEKYRNQQNVKVYTRGKSKFKRERKVKSRTQSPKIIDYPLGKLIREIHSDMKIIKTDLKSNNEKIDGLTKKVDTLESKSIESEARNTQTFADIREKLPKLKPQSPTK